MGHGLRATKRNDNAKSHARTKKESLVRWMATLNVVAKESPNTQRMGYGLRVAKMNGDAESRLGRSRHVADGVRSEGYEDRR